MRRVAALFAATLATTAAAQTITLDPTYGDGGWARVGATRQVPVLLEGRGVTDAPGGALVAGYSYTYASGYGGVPTLARIGSDGALEPSFGAGGLRRDTLAGTRFAAVAGGPGGTFVAVGYVLRGSLPADSGCDPPEVETDLLVVRYGPDGRRDSSFGTGGVVRLDVPRPLPVVTTPAARAACAPAGPYTHDEARAVAVDAAGRIVVGGTTATYFGTRYGVVARFLPGGAPDPGFGTGGLVVFAPATLATAEAVAVLPGGRVAVAGGPLVVLRADGRPDSTVGPGGQPVPLVERAHALAVGTDGRLVVAGSTGAAVGLGRYRADGRPDSTFGQTGALALDVRGGYERALAVGVGPDGAVTAAGDDGASRPLVVRVGADGSPDGAFTLPVPGGTGRAYGVHVGADGVARVAGGVQTGGRLFLARIAGALADAAVQTVAATGPYEARDEVYGLGALPDGRAVVAGQSDLNGLLVGFTPSGARDPAFQPADPRLLGFSVRPGTVLARPDGGLLVAGALNPQSIRTPAVFALDPTGRVERVFSFGVAASYEGASALGRSADGGLLVGAGEAGNPGAFSVARFRADGTLDPAFGTDGVATVRFPAAPSGSPFHLPALTEPLADGRVLVGGRVGDGFGFARLLADGRLDVTYAERGLLTGPAGFAFVAAARLPSGALAVLSHDAGQHLTLLRYTPDGLPDDRFGAAGRVGLGVSPSYSRGALLPLPARDGGADGPLLVGGTLGTGYDARPAVLRVGSDGAVLTDALRDLSRPYDAVVAFAPTAAGDVLALVQANAFGLDGYVVRLRGVAATDAATDAGASAFDLAAPAPNPARGRVAVRFTLDRPGPVQLTAHDVLGRAVAVLADGPLPAGAHAATLDAGRLAPGLYVVRLAADGRSLARPVTVVR